MTFNDTHANGLKTVEAMFGASLTWNGATFPCVVGADVEGLDLAAGGFTTTNNLPVVVRTELFGATRPAAKQVVSCKISSADPGRQYRILRVTPTMGDAFLRFDLESVI
jgi:hypothetical protein